MKFNIIKRSYAFIVIWIWLLLGSLFVFWKNINWSIEFTGWVSVKISTNSDKNLIKSDLEKLLSDKWYKDSNVLIDQKDWITSILLKLPVGNDSNVSDLSNAIKTNLLDKKYIESSDKILEMSIIWPSIWDYMKRTAFQAIIIWLIFMWIYVLFAFMSVREFISPFVLWVITIVTMLFDIALPMWAYWILMWINNTVQVDVIFVIAILTIIGYSINDTIIIFDRVRENFNLHRNKLQNHSETYADIFELSLWQTMRRSIWTSVTVFIIVLSMYIFGTWVLKLFSFTLMIWVIFGTYSSIFLAAPLAYILGKKRYEK